MARPSKNAEGPSATERMEMAFWECMKSMPFSEITVRDIVERANVNRNSYYYHYDSMWDLAQASVAHAKLAELAHILLGEESKPPKTQDGQDADKEQISLTELSAAYDSLRILASENGSQRLLDDAKNIISSEWLEMYKLDSQSNSNDIRLAVDFAFGGITALLAGEKFENLIEYRNSIEESDILFDTFDMLRAELDPAIDRKNRWLPRSSFKRTEEKIVVEHIVGGHSISESVVDEIMADVKSSQVKEVLAPQAPIVENPVLEPHTEPAPETVIEVVTESKIEKENDSVEMISEEVAELQEPVISEEFEDSPSDEESHDPIEETIQEEREPREEITEEAEEQTEQSESEPLQTKEEETQQVTEENHEKDAGQEPATESEIQEDFAPNEAIGVVSALESLQEIEIDDDDFEDEQEPSRKYDASAPSYHFADDDLFDAEDDSENATSYQSGIEDDLELDDDMSLDASIDLDMILTDASEDEDDEEDQLSMDFLF